MPQTCVRRKCHCQRFSTLICGFAAVHGGEPPAYRQASEKFRRLRLPFSKTGGIASGRKKGRLAGKPEAFRHVLRQSHPPLTTESGPPDSSGY
jgi:hypothetical protein